MHLKLLCIDLELLADLFEATFFSIEKCPLELEIDLSVKILVLSLNCELLLMLEKLIKSLQTIDLEPKIHDHQEALLSQKPAFYGIVIVKQRFEDQFKPATYVLRRLHLIVRIILLRQCFFYHLREIDLLMIQTIVKRLSVEGIRRLRRRPKLHDHVIHILVLRVL